MNNYKVYAHINKQNGKAYIGITKQELSARWRNGGKGYSA
jgi:predicted GIY-YIG superfamily endonuclease